MDSNVNIRKIPRPPMLTLTKSISITFRSPPKPPSRIEDETSSGIMWSVAARRGRRRLHREDMFSVLPFVDEHRANEPISIFGIFDGHGGHRVAKFASKRVPQLFLTRYKQFETIDMALENAFLSADQELMQQYSSETVIDPLEEGTFRRSSSGSQFASVALALNKTPRPASAAALSKRASRFSPEPPFALHQQQPQGDRRVEPPTPFAPSNKPHGDLLPTPTFARAKSKAEDCLSADPVHATRASGTTATLVVLFGSHLHLAQVGDSRAVLSGRDGVPIRLCEDHRPARKDEMERIEAAGGWVVDVSGTSRVNGVLAVSRAIGDAELKDYVIAEPEMNTITLSGQEEFLIVASDGLWDFVTDTESVMLIRDLILSSGNEDGCEEKAAQTLVQCAWDRGSNDDVSVIVVNLLKYCAIYERAREAGDGAIIEEIIEQVDLDKLRSQRVEDDGLKLETITPISYSLSTSRGRPNHSAW